MKIVNDVKGEIKKYWIKNRCLCFKTYENMVSVFYLQGKARKSPIKPDVFLSKNINILCITRWNKEDICLKFHHLRVLWCYRHINVSIRRENCVHSNPIFTKTIMILNFNWKPNKFILNLILQYFMNIMYS